LTRPVCGRIITVDTDLSFLCWEMKKAAFAGRPLCFLKLRCCETRSDGHCAKTCQSSAFLAVLACLAVRRINKLRVSGVGLRFDPHLQHQIYHHFRVYLTAVLSPEPLRMSITAPIRRWFTEPEFRRTWAAIVRIIIASANPSAMWGSPILRAKLAPHYIAAPPI